MCNIAGVLVLVVVELFAESSTNPNITAEVSPRDPYLYVGERLVLTCRLTSPPADKPIRHVLRRMKFFKSGPNVIQTIGKRSVRLELENVTTADEGEFVCGMGEKQYLSSAYLRVEHSPKAPKAINCEVFDWMQMNCSWEHVTYRHPDTVRTSLSWNALWTGYSGNVRDITTNFHLWGVNDNKSRLVANSDIYNISVSVENTERNTKDISPNFRVYSSNFVRPAGVSLDRFRLEDVNSSCLDVQWSFSAPYLSDRQTCTLLVDKVTKVNDKTNYRLCSLSPNVWYSIGIVCRPKSGGFNSTVTRRCHQMPEDVPSAAPAVTRGGYRETPCGHDCRLVTVFWQPLPEIHRNGKITSYRVRALSAGKRVRKWTVDGNKTSAVLTLNSTQEYSLYTAAATHVGFSRIESAVYLHPSYSPKVLAPPEFIVRSSREDRNVTISVSWQQNDLDSPNTLTVYFCRGVIVTQTCKGILNWIHVPRNQSQVNLHLSSQTDLHWVRTNYLFGVSVDSDTGSSGIVWANCTYIKNKKPEVAPKLIRFSKDSTGKYTVDWLPLSCEHSDYVITYKLRVCVFKQSKQCQAPRQVETVEGRKTDHTLFGLDPEEQYGLTIQAISDGGDGPESDMIISEAYRGSGWMVNILLAVLIPVGIASITAMAFGLKRLCCTQEHVKFIPPSSPAQSCELYTTGYEDDDKRCSYDSIHDVSACTKRCDAGDSKDPCYGLVPRGKDAAISDEQSPMLETHEKVKVAVKVIKEPQTSLKDDYLPNSVSDDSGQWELEEHLDTDTPYLPRGRYLQPTIPDYIRDVMTDSTCAELSTGQYVTRNDLERFNARN